MPELLLEGQPHRWLDLATFRAQYQAGADFGLPLFEVKDYTGLGRLDHDTRGGAILHDLRETVLSAIPAPPQRLPVYELPAFMARLANLFRVKLYELNDQIGLRSVEIDFAAAGFEDVGQALAYALIRARATGSLAAVHAEPDTVFEKIYAEWLDSSIRVAHTQLPFRTGECAGYVQIVSNAYGRIGLRVVLVAPAGTPAETPAGEAVTEGETEALFVADPVYACPAQGYMQGLLRAVAGRVVQTSV